MARVGLVVCLATSSKATLLESALNGCARLDATAAVLRVIPQHTDSMNNAGNCLSERARQRSGLERENDLNDAYMFWMRALDVDSTHRMARLNVALQLHSRGQYGAYGLSDRESSAFFCLQLGEFAHAVVNHERALALAKSIGAVNDAEQTLGHILKASIPACNWDNRENFVRSLVKQDERRILRGDGPVLLPFDTLLLPIDGATRLKTARAQSRMFEHYETNLPPRLGDEGIMTVAYLCHDFNDHPTAHLVEGLFRWHRRLRDVRGSRQGTYTAAISYGKDDGSSYREIIANDTDAFISVNTLGHNAAVEEARKWPRVEANGALVASGPSIAVDLQGHTLGTRMELAAMRVAPVQASYLIFPGTSGASFVDALFVDRYVVPPETAPTYSEKLVYLPGCYQINDYERHDFDRMLSSQEDSVDIMRASYNLPKRPAVVFCNFNKNDKLDPTSFGVWMSILRRVPDSVLWMLQPSKERAFEALKKNLEAEAAASGVSPSRLAWASRVPKARHLRRHAAADLFLDTFVYGAHSTATDALRGGVPFITVRGQSFPQRVGVSLLSNMGDITRRPASFICESLRDFEDMASNLATTRRRTLEILQRALIEDNDLSRLFDTAYFTHNIERAYKALWEAFRADENQTRRHVVVDDPRSSRVYSY
ncbi:hypothetical protein CTAYLR_001222 [Chrysophaeum taylorii]|uniref:O-GlcNAc transferase C-terminal domain-containing protein n=1 Tax=Chrysophaeum taylorii TaxID=2483200 RepID=A0AAD7UEQ7_9STRA|nr:hypothetical protein CTAYLR_001222 [Chrysophaeum taylorii]